MSTYSRRVTQKLGIDPSAAGVDELALAIRRLPDDECRALLSAAAETLRDPRLDEATRVAVVKVAVALMPDSEALIVRTLDARDRESDYENHFTLFCFLDAIQEDPVLRQPARRIPRIVGNYLMGVRSDTALAAWMAGDLLGDHWDGPEGVTILQEVLKKAGSPVARRAAVHGLAHRLSVTRGKSRARIASVLRNTSRHDRSEAVRAYARLILDRPGTH
jgi:hypothetical protein